MHKVKGLAFDLVITIPSYVDLPLKSHFGIDADDANKADFEEERRLLYVACTRARKALYVYEGNREFKSLFNTCFNGYEEKETGIMEKEQSLENYVISATANKYMKNSFSYIYDSLSLNVSVFIKKVIHNNHTFYNILCDGVCIGLLSPKSKIREAMINKKIDLLNNFIVSGIYVSTYEDALRYDKKRQEEIAMGKSKEVYRSIAKQWTEEAIKRGYTYVVTIAGFGYPPETTETKSLPPQKAD